MALVTNVSAPIGPGSMVHALPMPATTLITLTTPSRAIWVSSGATLIVTMNGDATPTTFAAVPAGTWMWISVVSVAVTNSAVGVILW